MRLLIFIVLFCAIQVNGFAQLEQSSTAINLVDKKGLKTGLWIIGHPEHMGESAYTEMGHFIAGLRYGQWLQMDELGDILAIERYKKDVKDGEVKYFEKGKLTCIGHYYGLNPDQATDTIYVMDPVTHYERKVVIETTRGTLKHGTWRYYDHLTGRLVREEDWQADEIIRHKDFPISTVDSAYFTQRNQNLPHVKMPKQKPKGSSLTH